MGWQIIEHKSAPASDMFDFTGLDLTGYQRVVLLLDGLVVGTDGAFVLLQLSTASTLRTSGYRYVTREYSSGGTSDSTSSSSASSIRLHGGSTSNWGVGNAAGESFSGKCEISNAKVALYKHVQADGAAVGPTGALVRSVVAGLLEQTGDIDGIRALLSTGTLSSGKATLYGLTTS